MMCELWIWKKRKYQEGQKDCHKFVRPHALEGDVLCAAHNPNCSGTLNMAKVFAKWADWNSVEQRQELLSQLEVYEEQNPASWGFEVFEDHIFIFVLSKHSLLKLYKTACKCEFSDPKFQVFLLISLCLSGVSVLEIQNLPHWKWQQSNVLGESFTVLKISILTDKIATSSS